jgi:hypothetical protein
MTDFTPNRAAVLEHTAPPPAARPSFSRSSGPASCDDVQASEQPMAEPTGSQSIVPGPIADIERAAIQARDDA